MSGMADVLRAHGVAGMSGGTHIACRCDRRWVLHDEYRTHLAAALSAAGFGDVREARAAAWDEGFATGKSRAMRHMSDEPNLPVSAPNPYRAAAVRGEG